jgi:very-short-patch-repair endonuclease
MVVEADGGIHSEPDVVQYDNARTARLSEAGIVVLRFTNEEIKTNPLSVISKIENWLKPNNTHS